jgi:hypothetical protein
LIGLTKTTSFSPAEKPEPLRTGRAVRAFFQKEEIVMSKMPPVPPENRSPKGTGADPEMKTDEHLPERKNLKEQGRQGNIHQNTHNQGYQQDR